MDVSNSDNRADYDCLSRFMLLRRKIADWARGAISLPPKQDCYQVCSWVETAYADLSCLGGLNCVFFLMLVGAIWFKHLTMQRCRARCQGLNFSQGWLQGFVTWRQIFQMFAASVWLWGFLAFPKKVWRMGMNITYRRALAAQFSTCSMLQYLRVLRTTAQIPFYLYRFRARRFSSSGWATSRWTTMKGHSFRRQNGDWVKAKDVFSTLIVREHQSFSENGVPLNPMTNHHFSPFKWHFGPNSWTHLNFHSIPT
jgi:hypothetical protein